MVSVVSVLAPVVGVDSLVDGLAGVVLLVVGTVPPLVVGTVPPFSCTKTISGILDGGTCFPLLDPVFLTSKPNLFLICLMCLSNCVAVNPPFVNSATIFSVKPVCTIVCLYFLFPKSSAVYGYFISSSTHSCMSLFSLKVTDSAFINFVCLWSPDIL